MSTDPGSVTLTEADVAADLGAIDPAAVPSIERPDGRPGFTESYAGAQLVDAAELPTAVERREAEPEPQPADLRELVMVDVMNHQGPDSRPASDEVLREAYHQAIDTVFAMRRALRSWYGA